MNGSLIIGRTVGTEGGFEFRWRDDEGVLPSGKEKASLKEQMSNKHHETFKVNPLHVEIVALPAWPDEKLYKHPSWREGAEQASHGLHWIDPEEDH